MTATAPTNELPAVPISQQDDSDGFRAETPTESVQDNAGVGADGWSVSESAQTMAEITRLQRSVSRRLAYLDALAYVDYCREEIVAILYDFLMLAVLADREHINNQLARARADRLITRDELLDGLRADIIARDWTDDDHADLLLVGECSITFNRDDLEIAARRADIIGRVTGVSTQAFLVTHYGDWPADIAEIARQLNVAVLQHQDPDHIDE